MRSEPLVTLGKLLRARGYRFTTVTPATHEIVVARPDRRHARTVRDALGWSLPFARGALDVEVEALLAEAGALVEERDGRVRSAVRASTLLRGDDALLLFHSAWPTDDADAVFFGPDTYRFAALLDRWLAPGSPAPGPRRLGRVVDVGAGSGAGGLFLARHATQVVLADINAGALFLSSVNAAVNAEANPGADVVVRESDVLRAFAPGAGAGDEIDVVVANPPYLVDADARTYRHGGERGIALPLRIVDEALARLRPGGRLVVYTGTPVVDGAALFVERARAIVERAGVADALFEELDPDVFGDELRGAAYADVERIALVGLLVIR